MNPEPQPFFPMDRSPRWGTNVPAIAAVIEVECVRLDDELPAGVKVSLIKMDIEGSEWRALASMPRILSTCGHVITEFDPVVLKKSGGDPLEFLQAFKAAGFVIHHIETGELNRPRWIRVAIRSDGRPARNPTCCGICTVNGPEDTSGNGDAAAGIGWGERLRTVKNLATRLGPILSKEIIHTLDASISYLETGRWLKSEGFVVPEAGRVAGQRIRPTYQRAARPADSLPRIRRLAGAIDSVLERTAAQS